ncbi:rhomboid-like protein [Streptomyces sp. NRRL S-340]|uniref:rhomboid-like protein n=1 Tax=Streptomyces sp. NRRL S-340 TaxID=1463901 RepID=UPI000A8BDB52|nr:rhomboid-like protein [Streptomyces sp. NRRL S-340]
MERTADTDAAAPPLVDGMPRQRPRTAPPAGAAPREAGRGEGVPGELSGRPESRGHGALPAVPALGAPAAPACARTRPASSPAAACGGRPGRASGSRFGGARVRRLLPGPGGTPFTFWYAIVLVVTSLVARYTDPAVLDALYRGSSTDVAHLVREPVGVLAASALWVAGGVVTAYSLCFLLVLTALERRVGSVRAAGVFLLGHVFATLATEIPVGVAVLAGRLPGAALHRLDYGISFGVAACVGALCGLLRPWLGGPVLVAFGGMLVVNLVAFTDPMTDSGHLIALAAGIACRPLLRPRAPVRAPRRPGPEFSFARDR